MSMRVLELYQHHQGKSAGSDPREVYVAAPNLIEAEARSIVAAQLRDTGRSGTRDRS